MGEPFVLVANFPTRRFGAEEAARALGAAGFESNMMLRVQLL
jgi:hypothetical protein